MKKLNVALMGLLVVGALGALPAMAFQVHNRFTPRQHQAPVVQHTDQNSQGDNDDNNGNENNEGHEHVASGGTSVPEPATLALLSLGLAGVGFARRRSKQ